MEHKCSMDKLDVQWQSYMEDDYTNHELKVNPLPEPKWRTNFICECGKEYTWQQIVDLVPFKVLGPR